MKRSLLHHRSQCLLLAACGDDDDAADSGTSDTEATEVAPATGSGSNIQESGVRRRDGRGGDR